MSGERRSPGENQGADAAGKPTSTAILDRCTHEYQRPTADGDLAICSASGRIIRAITRSGEVELTAMLAKWAPEPGEIGDGGDDYAIRGPVKSGASAPLSTERNGHKERAKWGAVAV